MRLAIAVQRPKVGHGGGASNPPRVTGVVGVIRVQFRSEPAVEVHLEERAEPAVRPPLHCGSGVSGASGSTWNRHREVDRIPARACSGGRPSDFRRGGVVADSRRATPGYFQAWRFRYVTGVPTQPRWSSMTLVACAVGPDRLSFVHAVRVVRRRVENPGVSPLVSE